MEPQSNVVNTKTWLAGRRDFTIHAYLEAYMPTFSYHQKTVLQQDFCEIFHEICLRTGETCTEIEPALDSEFRAWEELSDEALEVFERELG